jgi:hypothetical protein
VARAYLVNIVLAAGGAGDAPTYSVANAHHVEGRSHAIEYYAGLGWYPFAWKRGHNERTFWWHVDRDEGSGCAQPLWWTNFIAGASVTDPLQQRRADSRSAIVDAASGMRARGVVALV